MKGMSRLVGNKLRGRTRHGLTFHLLTLLSISPFPSSAFPAAHSSTKCLLTYSFTNTPRGSTLSLTRRKSSKRG